MRRALRRREVALGLLLPLILIVFILVADILEGPKTAYVGVLACVAPLAAAFGSIRMVIGVGVTAFIGALSIGYFASDGNVEAQNTRLVIIAIVSVLATAITASRIEAQRDMVNLAAELAVATALNHAGNKDFLTGSLNRHGIVFHLKEFNHPARSVVMIDLDNFKKINDVHGHKVGDEYIRAVTARISSELKAEDIFGRWGGDEFVAVLPSGEQQATEIFERVIARATQYPFAFEGKEIPIHFSAGVASWNSCETFEDALQNADRALYEAKAMGGQSVVNFAELEALGEGNKNAHQ
ncbi:MAG: diguanylate cyclase [Actinobacteria bacterium]|nr:diguanylate cyclase [Actinomycetota bacterium]